MKHKKWAVEFPDGDLPGQYFYDRKKDLLNHAPAAIYGDCSTWKRAKRDGYKIRRVGILILK